MLARFHALTWRHLPVVNWILMAGGFCLALLAARIHFSGRPSFYFLSWNLLLALLPLVFAAVALLLHGLGRRILARMALLPWLLFLPNAPYILTDLMHLKLRAPIPLWYDLLMLLSFALTGLLFGYLSMVCAERILLSTFKRRIVLLMHGAVLLLCGFGIYLGRILRWNSWDIMTRPVSLFRTIADRVLDPLAHPTTWLITLGMGGLLIIGFALVRSMPMMQGEEA